MPTKKYKQKLLKHQLCSVARVIACASFLILTIIGVSSLVRAMSLEAIANENGVPTSWEAASLGNPDTITVDVTYWDQRQDGCDDPNRQFEWVICGYWTAGAVQGLIKDTLGEDGLPIPTYTNSTDAWNANRDVFSANITGQDPVQPTDNFYRWFHETDVSKRFDRQVTFTRVGENTYTYGRDGVFPLDNVDFSDEDEATKQGHNYHFTSHLSFAMKVAANGKEKFEFSGDDDVWVFLNGKLVLDIGGLHEKLNGWFTINPDGTVSTYVQNVNDVNARESLGKPSNDFNSYVDPLNQLNRATFKDKYDTIDIGIKEGDVVNLDFFYAERSTTESNTKITISDMNWPISADSKINAKVVGKVESLENKLIESNTYIKNRDPENHLDLERLAAYISETTNDGINEGYLPLDHTTLFYTTTPNDNSSWQPVEISAPDISTSGFKLATPIRMAPAGQPGDTLYFRYFGETSEYSGTMSSTISYYTTLNGNAGVTYDYDKVSYTGKDTTTTPDPDPETPDEPEKPDTPEPSPEPEPETPEPNNPTPEEPPVDSDPDPEDPSEPIEPEPVNPEEPVEPNEPTPIPPENLPNIPVRPGSNIIDGDLLYLAPLGEVAFVPNTGAVGNAVASVFEAGFAEIIMSQAFVMAMLLIFAGSFSTYFSLRKYVVLPTKTTNNTMEPAKTAKTNKPRLAKKPTRKTNSKITKSNSRMTTVKITSPKTKTKK